MKLTTKTISLPAIQVRGSVEPGKMKEYEVRRFQLPVKVDDKEEWLTKVTHIVDHVFNPYVVHNMLFVTRTGEVKKTSGVFGRVADDEQNYFGQNTHWDESSCLDFEDEGTYRFSEFAEAMYNAYKALHENEEEVYDVDLSSISEVEFIEQLERLDYKLDV